MNDPHYHPRGGERTGASVNVRGSTTTRTGTADHERLRHAAERDGFAVRSVRHRRIADVARAAAATCRAGRPPARSGDGAGGLSGSSGGQTRRRSIGRPSSRPSHAMSCGRGPRPPAAVRCGQRKRGSTGCRELKRRDARFRQRVGTARRPNPWGGSRRAIDHCPATRFCWQSARGQHECGRRGVSAKHCELGTGAQLRRRCGEVTGLEAQGAALREVAVLALLHSSRSSAPSRP